MKGFVLEFFGLSCCLKSDDQVVVVDNKRGKEQQGRRRQRQPPESSRSALLQTSQRSDSSYRHGSNRSSIGVDNSSVHQRSSSNRNSYKRKPSTDNGPIDPPSNEQKSTVEKHIVEQDEPLPPHQRYIDDDIDNVTTISNASINPYRLLNISQSASQRDAHRGYKQKIKETQLEGGGEKAFRDIENAYRRINAAIERQERRRVEQQSKKYTKSSNNFGDGSSRSKGQRNNRSSSSSLRQQRVSNSPISESDDEEDSISSRATAIGARLKDHRELVKGLFANDDNNVVDNNKSTSNNEREVTSLQKAIYNQSQMLTEMNVVPIDAGATNVNEKKEIIANNCFYLSLAASYLCGVGAFAIDPTLEYSKQRLENDDSKQPVEMKVARLPKNEKQLTRKLALQLKRAIEAAVMLVHPDWKSSGMVGEEVLAFSDFIVYVLDSDSVLGHWSIAVFDEASGFVDVYRGRHYGKKYPPTKEISRNGREKLRYVDCDIATKRANTLTLRYIPGHYQPLLPQLTKMSNERRKARKSGKTSPASGLHRRATLEEIMDLLKKWDVLHVVTDGRA